MEASRIIKESWWLTDGKRSLGELHSAGGYALLDTTWPARDNTSTAIASHLVNSAAQVMFVSSKQRDTFTYHVGDDAVIASQDTERNVEIEEIRRRGEERCIESNIIALLHSFFSNLPREWLERTQAIIKHLRPLTSVAMLRIAFRVMRPLLPRLANAHTLFNKV
ncbi:hypothetical protein POTOM_035993 [Populus tomentosa]|uniref:Uncharacterized protein n=1 Tax=Populus tomentosa TaxID=118781 RepID=A0A8X7Z1Y1_POPTO|nr:hypothetical protein POTOM_035993 [Populus tomentosa]